MHLSLSTWPWHFLSQAHQGIVGAVQAKAQRAQLNPALVLQHATEHGLSMPLMLDLLTDFMQDIQALAQGRTSPQRVASLQGWLQRFGQEREALFKTFHRDVTQVLPEVLAMEDRTPYSQMSGAREANRDAVVLNFMRRIDKMAHQLVGVKPPVGCGEQTQLELLSLAWNAAQTSTSLNRDSRLALYELETELARVAFDRIAQPAQPAGIFLAPQWQAVLHLTPKSGVHHEVARLALQHTQAQADRYWSQPHWDNWPAPFPDFSDAASFAASAQNAELIRSFLRPPRLQHVRSLVHTPEDPALLKEKWRLLGFIGQILQAMAQLPARANPSTARKAALQNLRDRVEREFSALQPNPEALQKKAAWDQYKQALNHLVNLRGLIPLE
jgi:hypothetical protein